MKAYYIDSFSFESMHEMYNASSLKMFSCIYDEVIYSADISSKKNVEKLLNGLPQNIKYSQLYLPSNNKTKFNRLLSQILAIIYNCYFITKANRKETVIINYNTMIAIYFINFFAKIFDKKVLVVCHGEMQALCIHQNTSKIFRMSQKFFTNENQKIADKLYFAVLGDVILKNLKPYLSNNIFNKFKSFDHSGIFDNYSKTIKTTNANQLKIGAIGILRESKGLTGLIKLGNKLKTLKGQVEISIVGKVDSRVDEIVNSGIVVSKERNYFLTRNEMYDLIKKLDCILFLYPGDGYKITASGALFDAIACGISVLALKNDYFEYFFKKFGSVGCLVETYEDFEKEIKEMIEGKRYNVDFSDLKQQLQPQIVAESFKATLMDIKFI